MKGGWVFKIETKADRTVERFKARLVVQAFSQKFGTNYDEAFCPVVRQESLKIYTNSICVVGAVWTEATSS